MAAPLAQRRRIPSLSRQGHRPRRGEPKREASTLPMRRVYMPKAAVSLQMTHPAYTWIRG